MPLTRTQALLEIPPDIYIRLRDLLTEVSYEHCIRKSIRGDEYLDLSDLRLAPKPNEPQG